MKKRIWGGYQ